MRLFLCSIFICLIAFSCFTHRKSTNKKAKKSHSAYVDDRDTTEVGIKNGEKPSDVDFDGVADYEDADPKILVGSSYGYGSGSGRPDRNYSREVITRTVTNNVNSSSESEGLIAYSIPDKVKALEVFEVAIRIGRSTATINITSNMTGTVKQEVIRVSNRMEAKLVDPSASNMKMFEIIPNNNAVQIIEDNTYYTEWSWNVTALRAGKSYLTIVVSIIKGEDKRELVFKRNIEVDSNRPKATLIFIEKYWQWLMTAMILPFLAWFANKFLPVLLGRKKKSDDKSDS